MGIKGILKKTLCAAGAVLTVLLTVVATIIVFSIKWMFNTWSNLTMDELVYHMTAPLEGTNDGMIKEYLNTCIVPAVLVLFLMLILFFAFRGKKKYFVVMGAGAALSLVFSTISVHGAWKELDVGGYTKSRGTYSAFIDENYANPAEIEITFPEQKRNLIYIFLESMEKTYTDKENGGGFTDDYIPELTELAQENEDFSGTDTKLSGGYAMPGTTWTMGAMFGQTAGLPLIKDTANDMDTQDSFYKGAVTLGDVLEQAGYSQTLMVGSDATFGGRRLYFTEHGNYDILDYVYAHDTGMIPEDYKVFWGYEDEKLFGFAKEKLLELAGGESPFNLTMLTVDTHFEDGYPCHLCPDTYGDDQYANVMACSSRQVEEFVTWIQQQSFYENTTIVLVGDHPTMDKNFCEDVDSDYIRGVYTCYINAARTVETKAPRQYTTFDMFPTTLASMGVSIEGNRLGLGTNLFSSDQTLVERYGIETEKRELSKKSRMLEELANFDKTKEKFMLRYTKTPTSEISVGDYDFTTGLLPVTVGQPTNTTSGVEAVQIAVWTEANQEDLQWIRLGRQEDGNYSGYVNVPSFNYAVGEYKIHAYMVDSSGKQYKLGEAIGIVQ